MRTLLTTILFFTFLFSFAQTKEFKINWSGSKVYENDIETKTIPFSDNTPCSYTDTEGFYLYFQLDMMASNNSSAQIVNPTYERIDQSQIFDLQQELLPRSLEFEFQNTNARGIKRSFLKVYPFINDNGQLKRLTSFQLEVTNSSRATSNLRRDFGGLTNSVLKSGNWYRFYVEESGVYRLTRSFLSDLGINVNSLDPRTIKIYGNGGQMIPLLNNSDYPIDPFENAIVVEGEADGSFDNNDYILFYAVGPHGRHQHEYNLQFNSNINLFADKTYYYINIGSGLGKRVQELSEPESDPDLQISTYQDYQFFEEDKENLVKIGRRWFGEDFDLENQRQYEFTFPNLDTSVPLKVEVAIGSVAPFPFLTSMQIDINGNSSVLNLPPVDLTGSILASSSTFSEEVLVNSDDVTVNLTYNDASNPIANAYLDYINIEATRALRYVNAQLPFHNNDVAINPGIVEYTIENAQQVRSVWDITSISDVGSYSNSNSEPVFSFKANAGELRNYVAFSLNDVLTPKRENSSVLVNQDLKGTIFNNENGQFQDLDYVIIAPNNFLSQAERLAQINRNIYGLNVKVVSLGSIYNEFSTGNQDIAAIRNFIRYVYHNSSSPDKTIKYVCLFGDGSYDYKDRIANNTNIVPPWYSENSFSLTGSFVSDDFYTMMDENEGGMTSADRMDIAIGRILAENPQRAKDMVDKIESYYQDESFGNWRNNILLISDDVDERWERILQETTDNIGTSVESQKPFFNTVKIHSDAYMQESSAAGDRYPDVNDAMIDSDCRWRLCC